MHNHARQSPHRPHSPGRTSPHQIPFEDIRHWRGLGAFLRQQLKRICNHGDAIPCARCDPDNLASRRTLQKAGFVPCARVLSAHVPSAL